MHEKHDTCSLRRRSEPYTPVALRPFEEQIARHDRLRHKAVALVSWAIVELGVQPPPPLVCCWESLRHCKVAERLKAGTRRQQLRGRFQRSSPWVRRASSTPARARCRRCTTGRARCSGRAAHWAGGAAGSACSRQRHRRSRLDLCFPKHQARGKGPQTRPRRDYSTVASRCSFFWAPLLK